MSYQEEEQDVILPGAVSPQDFIGKPVTLAGQCIGSVTEAFEDERGIWITLSSGTKAWAVRFDEGCRPQ